MRVTFEDQQIDFYSRALREDFTFVADRVDSEEFANQSRQPFVGWDETVERDNTQRIFDGADRISAAFTDLSPPVFEVGGDTARIRKNYAFSVVEVDSVEGVETIVDSSYYKGTLTFFVRDEAGEWALYRWEDARPPELEIPSWGKLRGNTRP